MLLINYSELQLRQQAQSGVTRNRKVIMNLIKWGNRKPQLHYWTNKLNYRIVCLNKAISLLAGVSRNTQLYITVTHNTQMFGKYTSMSLYLPTETCKQFPWETKHTETSTLSFEHQLHIQLFFRSQYPFHNKYNTFNTQLLYIYKFAIIHCKAFLMSQFVMQNILTKSNTYGIPFVYRGKIGTYFAKILNIKTLYSSSKFVLSKQYLWNVK